MTSAWRFLRGFIENPGHVASVLPSSSALLSRLRDLKCLRDSEFVIELGPGTGETTQALLESMPAKSRLLSIELVPEFAVHLREMVIDPRLHVVQGNALKLTELSALHRELAPDAVISGVPFSHFSDEQANRLVRSVRVCLKPGGTFVAYQFRNDVRDHADELFGRPQVTAVPLNIPPLSIFEWSKPASTSKEMARSDWSLSRNHGAIGNKY